MTPLHDVACNGHVAAAELLLSKGAAVDAKRSDGAGPQSGKQAPDIESPTWGTSEGFSGIETYAFQALPKCFSRIEI